MFSVDVNDPAYVKPGTLLRILNGRIWSPIDVVIVAEGDIIMITEWDTLPLDTSGDATEAMQFNALTPTGQNRPFSAQSFFQFFEIANKKKDEQR